MEDKLYILQLENGKYYVGKTTDVKKRFDQHVCGNGAEWTKLHRPIKLLETRRIASEHDENNKTKDMMKTYGIDNVRGGSYCQIVLTDAIKKTLQTEIRGTSDTCFNCGENGHFVKDCPSNASEDDDDATCYRCGRETHLEKDCCRYTDVTGAYIGKPKRDPMRDWSDDDSD